MSTATAELYHPGLEGVIAGETAVSTIDNDELAYRGIRINQLADHNAPFEECAYLLLHGTLPSATQLAAFRADLDQHRRLPQPVIDCIRAIPKEVGGMEVMRTAVSMLSHFAPTFEETHEAMLRQAVHVLAAVPTIIAARWRLTEGHALLEPRAGLSHAAQFFHMALGRTPTELEERVMNLTFILYAEHEFNASTFAARVCTSTLSDFYSSIVTGIATLKGPLHGGANEEAIKLINRFKSGPEARDWTIHGLQTKAKIMGFGHRVYKHGDERAKILDKYVYQLGEALGEQNKLRVYEAIRDVMMEKKGIHPNLDYPCGMVYHFMKLPIDVYTPLFVASRVSGWAAHIIEQRLHNRIIRPRSRYIGPAVAPYVPIGKR